MMFASQMDAQELLRIREIASCTDAPLSDLLLTSEPLSFQQQIHSLNLLTENDFFGVVEADMKNPDEITFNSDEIKEPTKPEK